MTNYNKDMTPKNPMAPYWGLLLLDEGRFTWEFGSYDRSDVTSERQDYIDKGYKSYQLRIKHFEICPTQTEIEHLLTTLNLIGPQD